MARRNSRSGRGSTGVGVEGSVDGAVSGVGLGSPGLGSPAEASPAGASSPATPVKSVLTSKAHFLEQWTTPTKGKYEALPKPIPCNRPRCGENLKRFIPPGTSQNGVTWAVCEDEDCAGGGAILAYDTKCVACYGKIPEGTAALSLQLGPKDYHNQHLRNCLLDKNPDGNLAFAVKAATKDIDRECSTCVQESPIIVKGDIVLASAPIGTRLHYSCARKKRKDYLRIVFGAQDERHQKYKLTSAGASAEKKSKIESVVSPDQVDSDSDGEL